MAGAVQLLVVDDESDVRLLVRKQISRDPRLNIVGEAVSARDALGLACTQQPDVVILDHVLTGDIRGMQVASLLKGVAPDARILLFSAFDVGEQAANEPDVDAFLSKMEVTKLRSVVQKLAGLSPEPA